MEEKTIFIFDMDDTLVKTPKLEDVIQIKNGKVSSGDQGIDTAMQKMLKSISEVLSNEEDEKNRMKQLAGIGNDAFFVKENDDIVLYFNGKPIDKGVLLNAVQNSSLTPKEKTKILNSLDYKDGKIVLSFFGEFFSTESTVGTEINKDVVDVYEKVKNKMIVTGRSQGIKKGVSYILFNIIGLSEPNFGLHLYDGCNIGKVPGFKADVIIQSIKENGWNEVHFYEDRLDWLNFVEGIVRIEFPDVKFHKHFVDSVK